jgi:hypothetical protein
VLHAGVRKLVAQGESGLPAADDGDFNCFWH